ncbi:MAG: hypothetical protein V4598_11850 [Bdellovibrionota bacterium]
MNIFSDHILGWAIVLIMIGAGFYTMKVIGEEKSSFKDESYKVSFGPLTLIIPNWWSIVSQTDHAIRFERTDTRYDWYAVFQYHPAHEGKDLPELLKEKLNLEEMEFDEDVVFETDSRVLFRDSRVQEYFQEVIRVEGKGSQKVIERFYYDLYLMRAQNDAGYFIFESRSSVLNGLVEGPYFEESLSELELAT